MTTQTANVASSNFNIMEEDLRVFCMGYTESYCNNASGLFASSSFQTNSFMFDRTYTSEMAHQQEVRFTPSKAIATSAIISSAGLTLSLIIASMWYGCDQPIWYGT